MITPNILSTRATSTLPARAPAHNTTAIDKHVGWVSSTTGRSTSGILWSCFSILLVCTYKCIHFNVPSRLESNAAWFTRPWWRKQLRKAGWMMMIVLAPEVGVGVAMDQYLFARQICYDVRNEQENQKEDPRDDKRNEGAAVENGEKNADSMEIRMNVDEETQEITKTHVFFANMGGFNLRICALSFPEKDHTQRMEISSDDVSKAGVVIPKPVTLHEVSVPIKNWEEFDKIRKIFPDLKMPTEKEISDLSKADAFTKAFACIQSSWLIIQSIARLSVGLPITQLELATMAFVVCALIMYLLWWNKPFGVEHRIPITVITYDESVKTRAADYLYGNSYEDRNFFAQMLGEKKMPEIVQGREYATAKASFIQEIQEIHETDLDRYLFSNIMADDLAEIDYELFRALKRALWTMIRRIFGNSDFVDIHRKPTKTLTFYAISVLFSAFHIAAWNWEFPSSTTRMLWRIFAVAATGANPVIILLSLTMQANWFIDFIRILIYLFLFIYAASRIGLLVLIFYTFSSMPAGVYETVNWLQYLPSFS